MMVKLFRLALGLFGITLLFSFADGKPINDVAKIVIGPLGVLVIVLFFLKSRPKRHLGLLNANARTPLSADDRKAIAAATVFRAHEARRRPNGPEYLVITEVAKIQKGWAAKKSGRTLSDDELRSAHQLSTYALYPRDIPEHLKTEMLKDVKDLKIFHALRAKALEISAQNAQKHAEDLGRRRAGTPATDALENGWLAFLKSLHGVDVHLWHDFVTDFKDIGPDEVDGAFWVLEQPECDRATASDFIRGFAAYGDLMSYAIEGDVEVLSKYRDTILRYNSGFYKTFAIEPDIYGIEPHDRTITGEFDTQAVIDIFVQVEAKTGIPPLPRPEDLLSYLDRPTHKISPDAYRAPYDYRHEEAMPLYAL